MRISLMLQRFEEKWRELRESRIGNVKVKGLPTEADNSEYFIEKDKMVLNWF